MGTEIEKLHALREFLEWYDQHYTTPLDVKADVNGVMVYIQHDITKELEDCVIECVQQTKKILSKEVAEEKIQESCSDGCFSHVVAYIDAMFDDIREKLSKHLSNYIRQVEEGWVDVYRYLVVYL